MDKEIYSKYKLYRQYYTSDGVNYTPTDKYQAVKIGGTENSCDCGFYYWGSWENNGYTCGYTLLDKNNPTLINFSSSTIYKFENSTLIDSYDAWTKNKNIYYSYGNALDQGMYFTLFSGMTFSPNTNVRVTVLYDERNIANNKRYEPNFEFTYQLGQFNDDNTIKTATTANFEKVTDYVYRSTFVVDSTISSSKHHFMKFIKWHTISNSSNNSEQYELRRDNITNILVRVEVFNDYYPDNNYKNQIKYQYCDGNKIPTNGDSYHSSYSPQTKISTTSYIDNGCKEVFSYGATETTKEYEYTEDIGLTCLPIERTNIITYQTFNLTSNHNGGNNIGNINYSYPILSKKQYEKIGYSHIYITTATGPNTYVTSTDKNRININDEKYESTYKSNGEIQETSHLSTETIKSAYIIEYNGESAETIRPNGVGSCCDVCSSWGSYGGTYYGNAKIDDQYYFMFENRMEAIPTFTVNYSMRNWSVGAFQPFGDGTGCGAKYNSTLNNLTYIKTSPNIYSIGAYAFANSHLECVEIEASFIESTDAIFTSNPSNEGSNSSIYFVNYPSNLKTIILHCTSVPSAKLLTNNKLPDNGVLKHKAGLDYSSWMAILEPKGWTEETF